MPGELEAGREWAVTQPAPRLPGLPAPPPGAAAAAAAHSPTG